MGLPRRGARIARAEKFRSEFEQEATERAEPDTNLDNSPALPLRMGQARCLVLHRDDRRQRVGGTLLVNGLPPASTGFDHLH